MGATLEFAPVVGPRAVVGQLPQRSHDGLLQL
jgi:hypothetical protein